jgi:hypothetical protein
LLQLSLTIVSCVHTPRLISHSGLLGAHTSYYGIHKKEQFIEFLNSKIKSVEEDPDKKSITTWNDYLGDIKYFFRWLHNEKKLEKGLCEKEVEWSDWETPHLSELRKR